MQIHKEHGIDLALSIWYYIDLDVQVLVIVFLYLTGPMDCLPVTQMTFYITMNQTSRLTTIPPMYFYKGSGYNLSNNGSFISLILRLKTTTMYDFCKFSFKI